MKPCRNSPPAQFRRPMECWGGPLDGVRVAEPPSQWSHAHRDGSYFRARWADDFQSVIYFDRWYWQPCQ